MRSLRMALTPEHVAQAHRVLEDPGPDPTWTYFTVAHLEEQGIRDRNLWRLQALVAERIKPNTSDPPDRAASQVP